jgi:hypothetical protein
MLDAHKARACLLSNLLVLPGIGSLAGGRRIGWAQIGLAAIGLCASSAGTVLSYRWIMKNREAMVGGMADPDGLLFPLGVAVGGLVVFAVAWLWALSTGISMLYHAKQVQVPAP